MWDCVVEITCVNETGLSLARFIHDLGIDLRCGAVCNKLRRLRFGYFDVSHALTHLQWDSSSIIGNIETCQPITALAMLDRANQLAESTKNKHNLLKGSVADWKAVIDNSCYKNNCTKVYILLEIVFWTILSSLYFRKLKKLILILYRYFISHLKIIGKNIHVYIYSLHSQITQMTKFDNIT